MPRLITRKWFTLFPIALVLIIAACSSGGDDDGSSQADDRDTSSDQAVAAEGVTAPAATNQTGGDDEADDATTVPALEDDSDYARALRAVVEEIELKLDAAAEDFQDEALAALATIDLADEDAFDELLAEVLTTFGPRLIQIIEDGIDDVENLDPPDRFEDDHRRFVSTIRQLFELQSGIFKQAQEGGFSAEQELEDLTTRIEELEKDLRDSISPEFFIIIQPFFDDADEEAESLGEIGGDENVTLTRGDESVSVGSNLPDSYPDELIPPNSRLDSALSATENGVSSTVAFWSSTTNADDLLDFFEDAFKELGIEGDKDRISAGGISALSVSDGDGNPLAGVIIRPSESGDESDVIVTIIGS